MPLVYFFTSFSVAFLNFSSAFINFLWSSSLSTLPEMRGVFLLNNLLQLKDNYKKQSTI